VSSSFGLSIKYDYVDLPSLYWIHKCPYTENYIAGSAKISKTLSKLLSFLPLETLKNVQKSEQEVNRKWHKYCYIQRLWRRKRTLSRNTTLTQKLEIMSKSGY